MAEFPEFEEETVGEASIENEVVEEIPESIDEETFEPIVEEIPEPIIEEISESIVEEVPEPIIEEISESIDEETLEPIIEEIPEPIIEEISESIVEEVPEPIIEEISEPIVEEVPEPIIEEISEQTIEEISEDSITETVTEKIAENNIFKPTSIIANKRVNRQRDGHISEDDNLKAKKKTKTVAKSTKLRAPAPPEDDEEYEVINLNKELIENRFNSIFEKFNCCQCNACKFTVMAIALNELPSKYIAVKVSEHAKIIEEADDSQIRAAVIQAVLKLMIHPIHPSDIS